MSSGRKAVAKSSSTASDYVALTETQLGIRLGCLFLTITIGNYFLIFWAVCCRSPLSDGLVFLFLLTLSALAITPAVLWSYPPSVFCSALRARILFGSPVLMLGIAWLLLFPWVCEGEGDPIAIGLPLILLQTSLVSMLAMWALNRFIVLLLATMVLSSLGTIAATLHIAAASLAT